MIENPPKNPVGRPTKYKPEYCELAIEVLSEGYSILALAAKCDVAEHTIYNWQEEYPDFLQAVKIGQAKSAMWWEDRIRAISDGEDGNATAAIFGLKNRSKSQWADISKTEHTGANGGAIKTENKQIVELSDADLEKIARGE